MKKTMASKTIKNKVDPEPTDKAAFVVNTYQMLSIDKDGEEQYVGRFVEGQTIEGCQRPRERKQLSTPQT